MLIRFKESFCDGDEFVYVNPDRVSKVESNNIERDEDTIIELDGDKCAIVNEPLAQVVKKLNEELKGKRS